PSSMMSAFRGGRERAASTPTIWKSTTRSTQIQYRVRAASTRRSRVTSFLPRGRRAERARATREDYAVRPRAASDFRPDPRTAESARRHRYGGLSPHRGGGDHVGRGGTRRVVYRGPGESPRPTSHHHRARTPAGGPAGSDGARRPAGSGRRGADGAGPDGPGSAGPRGPADGRPRRAAAPAGSAAPGRARRPHPAERRGRGGDTSVWEDSVDPECQVCGRFLDNAQVLDEQGGYLVGGAFDVHSTTFSGNGEPPATGTVVAEFTQEESILVDDPQLQANQLGSVTGQLIAAVAWDGERWRVTDMSIAPPEAEAPSDGGGAGADDADDAGGASDAGGAAG